MWCPDPIDYSTDMPCNGPGKKPIKHNNVTFSPGLGPLLDHDQVTIPPRGWQMANGKWQMANEIPDVCKTDIVIL